jgi:hypothetical protein
MVGSDGGLKAFAGVPFYAAMGMSLGGVNSPLTAAASSAGAGVQGQMAIGVLKKAQQVDAESVKQLIASATGVGQKLDVTG